MNYSWLVAARRHLTQAAVGGMVLGALAAPFFYGGTISPSREALVLMLLATSSLACLLQLSSLGRYRIWGAWLLFLLGIGWWSATHPTGWFDSGLRLVFPLASASTGNDWASLRDWQPRALDASLAQAALLRCTALGLFITALLAWLRHRRQAHRLLQAMALLGLGVSLHGLLQKLDSSFLNYWQGRTLPDNVFAGFWYHANAAALLNLCWPCALAAAWEAFQLRPTSLHRALWTLALALIGVGLAVNVSKAGHLIAIVQAVAWLTLLATGRVQWRIKEHHLRPHRKRWVRGLLIGGGSTLLIGLFVIWGSNRSLERWQEWWARDWHQEGRLLSMAWCWEQLPRVGPWGIGAGNFEAFFLDTATRAPETVPQPGRWRHAHSDPLQFLLEWGWLGGGVILAGMAALFARLGFILLSDRPLDHQPSLSQWRRAAIAIALSGCAFHGTFDFPWQILGIQAPACLLIALAIAESAPRAGREQNRPAHRLD